MSVLLLGGTAEARALAERLVGCDVPVLSSLAGRVARPRLPVGPVRIGGFGGADGLRDWLVEHEASAVVDATHPFAERISVHAATACRSAGVPLLRLQRPGWAELPAAEGWHWVEDHRAAAIAAARLGVRPFLTVGRQPLRAFLGPLRDAAALVRVVDPPEVVLPERWRVVLGRGPYTADTERAMFLDHGADVLVTKDSGGGLTRPKLDVADTLGLPVVIVRRPRPPAGVDTVSDVEAALSWVLRQRS